MLQVSKMQYDKIFSFIESGKQEGAKAILGGEKRPGKGYFVDPTSKLLPSQTYILQLLTRLPWRAVFVDVTPDMKIVRFTGCVSSHESC